MFFLANCTHTYIHANLNYLIIFLTSFWCNHTIMNGVGNIYA